MKTITDLPRQKQLQARAFAWLCIYSIYRVEQIIALDQDSIFCLIQQHYTGGLAAFVAAN